MNNWSMIGLGAGGPTLIDWRTAGLAGVEVHHFVQGRDVQAQKEDLVATCYDVRGRKQRVVLSGLRSALSTAFPEFPPPKKPLWVQEEPRWSRAAFLRGPLDLSEGRISDLDLLEILRALRDCGSRRTFVVISTDRDEFNIADYRAQLGYLRILILIQTLTLLNWLMTLLLRLYKLKEIKAGIVHSERPWFLLHGTRPPRTAALRPALG